jgi:hypothetical protein
LATVATAALALASTLATVSTGSAAPLTSVSCGVTATAGNQLLATPTPTGGTFTDPTTISWTETGPTGPHSGTGATFSFPDATTPGTFLVNVTASVTPTGGGTAEIDTNQCGESIAGPTFGCTFPNASTNAADIFVAVVGQQVTAAASVPPPNTPSQLTNVSWSVSGPASATQSGGAAFTFVPTGTGDARVTIHGDLPGNPGQTGFCSIEIDPAAAAPLVANAKFTG